MQAERLPASANPEESRRIAALKRENAELLFEMETLRRQLAAAGKTEQLVAFRLDLMIFGRDHTLEELLIRTLDRLEELTSSKIGFYHFIGEDENTILLQAWSTATTAKFCTAQGKSSHYEVAKAGVWVDCLRERRAVVHNDYSQHPNKRGLPEGHAKLARELVVPVFRGERIVAILGVGNKPTEYDQGDVEIVSRFADLAWDVAERKLVHEQLKESEARFRAIADYSYDWELWVGPEGKLLWTNPASADFTGYTPEELLGMKSIVATLVKENDREKVRRHVAAALAGGSANNVEIRFLTKEGRVKWGGISYRPIHGSGGEEMGFRASVRDISKLKQTEQELDSLNEKLIDMLAQRVVKP